MLDETFDAGLLRMALFGSQRFAVVSEHHTGISLSGFDIEPGGGSLRRRRGAAKQEVGAVVIGRINFVLHCFVHEFRWIPIRRNGRGLASKTGRGEQQNPSARADDETGDGIAQARFGDRYKWTEHVNPVQTW